MKQQTVFILIAQYPTLEKATQIEWSLKISLNIFGGKKRMMQKRWTRWLKYKF